MTQIPSVADRPWYTLEEAAGLLGCSLKTAHNLIHLETFPVPYVKLGRRVVVMKEVIDRYFEHRANEGIAELKTREPRPRRAQTLR